LSNEDESKSENSGSVIRDLLVALVEIVVREIVKLVTAFAFGTAAGAVFCWYFDLPLVYALGAGFVMMIIVLAMLPGSVFSG
jgi:hypothetical protein